MNTRVFRICSQFLPGGLVLLLSAAVVTERIAPPPSASELLRFAPFVVFGAGIVLSGVFHRSRILQALLLLAVATLALTQGIARLDPATQPFLIGAVGVLLPLNIVLIVFLPETGIFTRHAFVRLLALVLQLTLVVVTWHFYLPQATYWVNRPLLLMLPFTTFHGLPHSVLVISGIAMLLLVIPLQRRRFRPGDIGIFWALLASIAALVVCRSQRSVSLAFTAGAIVLVIALLETFYAMAYVDELTDLPGRRSFNDAKLKLGSTYTVAMVDVDHFKNFNDTYGHDAGDQVLRMVAAQLAKISGGGKAYRYGGEEFAVLFPGKEVDETFPHLERMRRDIEDIPFKIRGKDRRRRRTQNNGKRQNRSNKQAKITVSIGAAGIAGVKKNPEEMVKAADKALYRAKSCGRNCTVVSESA
ncbi:MAG TPA: GGDEF domain-containing protein [Terriglobales bacterium]|nr:GGDEF domain-containing protein [Terriglobales bacterium]